MQVPDGWRARACAGRLIGAGACTYAELINGSLNLHDVFEMLCVLDWNNHATATHKAMPETEFAV